MTYEERKKANRAYGIIVQLLFSDFYSSSECWGKCQERDRVDSHNLPEWWKVRAAVQQYILVGIIASDRRDTEHSVLRDLASSCKCALLSLEDGALGGPALLSHTEHHLRWLRRDRGVDWPGSWYRVGVLFARPLELSSNMAKDETITAGFRRNPVRITLSREEYKKLKAGFILSWSFWRQCDIPSKWGRGSQLCYKGQHIPMTQFDTSGRTALVRIGD